MATQYPNNDMHVIDDRIDELKQRILDLEAQNKQLNLDLMDKSAKESEASEALKRIRLEWEIVADQTGHNMCHMAIAKALMATIGRTGNYPDPENVSGEQFAYGCVKYQKDVYPECRFRLQVLEIGRVG